MKRKHKDRLNQMRAIVKETRPLQRPRLRQYSLKKTPDTSEPLIKSILVEAWSLGERRAYARGWLDEFAQRFTVTPFYLREVGGGAVPFQRGAAISTLTFDQATVALAAWATDMMALRAPLRR
jgi:hypothetical protein